MMLDELLEWAWLVLDFEKPEWRDPLVEHSYQCPIPFFRGGKITAASGALLCQGSVWDVTCLSWRGDFLSIHRGLARCPSIRSHRHGTLSLKNVLGCGWRLFMWKGLTGWGLERLSEQGCGCSHWVTYEFWARCEWWVATQGPIWCWFAFPAAPRYCWEIRGC